ncbi:hypothetical protein SDRG_11569 [Saprolegnia diclina VS20]|uniref:Radial spoke head 10 family protein n=1 Tax=Saprolegnia diclina (strain VS20) TaxID=1156394 RepID=T0PZ15_SAPDV|nr:hypothetical protein SDRG_11569 [Saprolegnia diclina VS20]EQC30809.1 hypothetical protein SDRG_11569 [Saprolegnia diclina VS20]|eukprot:XP_008615833.1 hypothetical protein SDRG_11569 [Saprolegnia diclina VS20]
MAAPQFPLDPSLAALIIASYEGETQHGVFHGHGCATFVNGQVYVGSFLGGRMHGHGALTWPDGVTYEGDFEFNEVSGRGKYVWPDESWYEGDVSRGRRHGHGYFMSSNRVTSYEGAWVHGYQHGYGKLVYDEFQGIEYEGDWVTGQRHGKGTMKYASGNVYEGDWVDGKKAGKGTMHWFDAAETYDGDWHDDHGLGLFFFEDGTIYEGEFVRDRMVDINDNKSKNAETLPTLVLYIDDILRHEEKSRALKATQHAVLRANTDLRNVYRHYASCGGTTTAHASTENTVLMEMRELWRFSAECRLNVSMGKLNRYLLVVRNAQNKAVKKLRIQREKKRRHMNSRAMDAIETPREKWTDIHDPDRVVLFREFCEILVRIAWDDALERGEVDMTVADAFTYLYDAKIHDHASTPMLPMEAIEISVHSLEMQTVFQKYQELLEKLFAQYSGPVATPENDLHLTTGNFVLMLKEKRGLGALGVPGVLKCLRKTNDEEGGGDFDPFLLDAELIYPEFLEAIAKVAMAAATRNLPMPVLVAQYIRDTFEKPPRAMSLRRLTTVLEPKKSMTHF